MRQLLPGGAQIALGPAELGYVLVQLAEARVVDIIVYLGLRLLGGESQQFLAGANLQLQGLNLGSLLRDLVFERVGL